jgi:methionyl-tRNA formyltransferase
MNLVFLGSGAFGRPTLEHLSRIHTVRGVVTQPARKAGRGGKLTPTPIGAWASEHLPGVPVLTPERINEASVRDQIRAFPADAWVVIAFGQYLGRSLISERFAINLHASLLPRWRGAAPINAAVLAGDEQTGNSVITIAPTMDAGPVLGQSRRAVGPDQTAGELHDLLAMDGPELVAQTLSRHADGTLRGVEQDESQVTQAGKLSKADGWIDFADTAQAVRRRVNGLTPWPGVTIQHRGQALKVLRVGIGPETDREPGAILDANGLVACGGRSTIRLIDVQPPGKRAMAWSAYARGRDVKSGERLVGRGASVG